MNSRGADPSSLIPNSSSPRAADRGSRARDRVRAVRVRFPGHRPGRADLDKLVLDHGTRSQLDCSGPERVALRILRCAERDAAAGAPVAEGGDISGAVTRAGCRSTLRPRTTRGKKKKQADSLPSVTHILTVSPQEVVTSSLKVMPTVASVQVLEVAKCSKVRSKRS